MTTPPEPGRDTPLPLLRIVARGVAVLRLLLVGVLARFMMTDGTARAGTDQAVVPGHVARHAADHRALGTARGVGMHRGQGQSHRQQERRRNPRQFHDVALSIMTCGGTATQRSGRRCTAVAITHRRSGAVHCAFPPTVRAHSWNETEGGVSARTPPAAGTSSLAWP